MATSAMGAQAQWAFAEHEHRDLVRGLNRLHDIAGEIGHRPPAELSVHVLGILDWLDFVLRPHIAWEDTWLFPEIDARAGTPWATRAARLDHQQIREMAARLVADRPLLTERPSPEQRAEIRSHLFGLEALVRAHIEREERYLLPLLAEDRAPGQPPPDRPA
jgi:hemerythrin-like domain-containing protein